MEHINIVLFTHLYLDVITTISKDTNGQWWKHKYVL